MLSLVGPPPYLSAREAVSQGHRRRAHSQTDVSNQQTDISNQQTDVTYGQTNVSHSQTDVSHGQTGISQDQATYVQQDTLLDQDENSEELEVVGDVQVIIASQ